MSESSLEVHCRTGSLENLLNPQQVAGTGQILIKSKGLEAREPQLKEIISNAMSIKSDRFCLEQEDSRLLLSLSATGG